MRLLLLSLSLTYIITLASVDVHVGHEDRKIQTPGGSSIFLHSIIGTQVSENSKGKNDIVLLHGAKFSAATWEKLGTIKLLANEGYRVFAFDLPGGKGVTRVEYNGEGAGEEAPEQLLNSIMESYGISNSIIISPSMSGRYSLPYIQRYSDRVKGYVPIAPTIPPGYNINSIDASFPALVIWGQNDTMGKERSKIFAELKGMKEMLEIPRASHPCYLDEPGIFHTALISWVRKVSPN